MHGTPRPLSRGSSRLALTALARLQLDLPDKATWLAVAALNAAKQAGGEGAPQGSNAWRHPPSNLPMPPELEPVDDRLLKGDWLR